jgi:hypothetical protein
LAMCYQACPVQVTIGTITQIKDERETCNIYP